MYQQIGKEMHGGMGVVYHLYHRLWHLDVAMKRPKVFNDLYLSECEKWINLGIHPNIVQCFYIQYNNNLPCIISEWMKDGNLREYVEHNTLTLDKIIDIAIQIANGLAYAHQNKLLHLDIKPENVLFNGNFVKIGDFGISTYFHENPTIYMTPHYCSPEQLLQMNVNETSDVYSWALCVLFMLIGNDDWDNSLEASKHIDDYLRQSRFEVPEYLKELIISCLNQDYNQRPKKFYLITSKLNILYRQITKSFYPFENILNYKTNDLDSKNNYAVSQILLGNNDQARMLFKNILKTNPDHIYAKYNYRYCFDWFYQDYPNRLMNYKELPIELQCRFLSSINAYHEAYKQSNSIDYLKLFETHGAFQQKSFEKPSNDICYFFATKTEGKFIYIDNKGNINGCETPLKNPCCAAKSKDDHFIALAQNINFLGFTYQILIYDIKTMSIIHSFKATSGQIKSIDFTHSNQLIVLTSDGVLLYVPEHNKGYPFKCNEAFLKIDCLYQLPNSYFAGFSNIKQKSWTCCLFDSKLNLIKQFIHYQPNVHLCIHPNLPYALMSTLEGGYEVYDLLKGSLISMDQQLDFSIFDIVQDHIYCLSDNIIQRNLPQDFTVKPAFLIMQSYTTEKIISKEKHYNLVIQKLINNKASINDLLELNNHPQYYFYTHYLLGCYTIKSIKLHKKETKYFMTDPNTTILNSYVKTSFKGNLIEFYSNNNQFIASLELDRYYYNYGYNKDFSQLVFKTDDYVYDIYDIEWIYQ